MSNPIIETDLAEILGQINQKLDKLSEEVTDLKTEMKVGFAEVKGEIKALNVQVEQLDKRITNSEFTSRYNGW
jgi:peptidoglycan hydrolase CwlO-like protein